MLSLAMLRVRGGSPSPSILCPSRLPFLPGIVCVYVCACVVCVCV
jgi:hypothetical protein